MAVFALGVGGLALRLAQGPIDLAPLREDVARGIASAIAEEHQVEFGAVELAWANGAPRVSVSDLSVRTPDGRLVAAAPRAYVGLSGRALLSGRVEAISLIARAPVLGVTLATGGGLVAGGPDPRAERGPRSAVLALLDPDTIGKTLARSGATTGATTIGHVELDDVSVALRDEATGQVRLLEPFDLSLRYRGRFLDARLSEGHGGRWSVAAAIAEIDGAPRLSVELEGLTGADILGPDAGALAPMRLRGWASGAVDDAGGVARFSGVIEIGGSGAIVGPDFRATVGPAALVFSFVPAQRTLEIQRSRARVGGVGGLVEGRAVLPAPADPTRVVRWSLALEGLELAEDGTRAKEIDRIDASGAFEQASKRLYVDSIEAKGPSGRVAVGRGEVIFGGPTPGVRLEASAAGVSAESIKKLWPPFMAPESRDWFMTRVEAGTLDHGTVDLRVPPGWLDGRQLRREMFRGEWRASGASVRLAPELPPVIGLSAFIRTSGISIHVTGRDGTMVLPAGTVTVPTVDFVADNLDRHDEAVGVLKARALGTAGALLDLGERQGMPIARGGGFDPRAISGDGSADIEVSIPLWPGPRAPEPRNRTVAELVNVSGRGLVEGRDLERGMFRIESDGKSFSAEGTASVAGVPVKLSARREPGDKVVLRAELDTDDAQRARFGLQLAPMVTGPIAARLTRELVGNETTRRVELDLTQARLSLPDMAFEKARGVPATLTAMPRGRDRERITGFDDLVLLGRGFSVRGRVRLGEDNLPTLIDLSDVRLRPDDQFAARVERTDGQTNVRLSGRSIDLRPFLRSFITEDDAEPRPEPMDINVRVDRVVGHNGVTVSDLRLELRRTGARITDLKLSGSFGGATRIVGEVLADRGLPYLYVSSTDGGSALRFLNVYRNVRGGRLTVTQTLTDPTGQRADGVILMDDFRVVEDQALERLFGAAPADPEGQLRRIRTSDVPFDRMRVVFTRAPGSITLSEGVLRNVNVGMTYEGRIDLRRQSVDARGVFIPAFALNNFLARIPVIGAFLGGQNEGLIGVTYQVVGPLAGPTLQINPASAIAPGFLRHLFAFPDARDSFRPRGIEN